jgi:hypothetical protein
MRQLLVVRTPYLDHQRVGAMYILPWNLVASYYLDLE